MIVRHLHCRDVFDEGGYRRETSLLLWAITYVTLLFVVTVYSLVYGGGEDARRRDCAPNYHYPPDPETEREDSGKPVILPS